jgi:hypothetical protein
MVKAAYSDAQRENRWLYYGHILTSLHRRKPDYIGGAKMNFKRVSFGVLALFVLFVTPLTAHAWADITATVITEDGASIRDDIFDWADVLAVVPFGEAVKFDNELEYAMGEYNNISGFVKLEDFDIDTSKGYMIGTVLVETGTALLDFPYDSGDAKIVIPVGETVEFDQYSDWKNVKYNGVSGWVKLIDFKISVASSAEATLPISTPEPTTTSTQNTTLESDTTRESTSAIVTTPKPFTSPAVQKPSVYELGDYDYTSTTTHPNDTNYWPWIIGIGVLIIAIWILSIHLRIAKCPKCKARKPQETSREEGKSERIYFTETEQIKEYKNRRGLMGEIAPKASTWGQAPDKIVKREYKVPGTRTWYTVSYKCRNCGEIFQRSEYVDRKD